MDKRVSVITLGVADVARAQAFYEELGWRLDDGVDDENDQIAFFQAGCSIVSLWDRRQLAADSGVEDKRSWAGATLGYNVGSPEEVDAVMAEARAAGAAVTREAGKTFWGGYSGVFVDPDGHPWEVAHNSAWTLRGDGAVALGRRR